MRVLASLSIQRQIGGLVIGLVALTASVLLSVMVYTLTRDVRDVAAESLNLSLRVAATVMAAEIPNARVVWSTEGEADEITFDEFPVFEDHEIIDRISRATDRVATIFAWDEARQDFVRVTTSVRKPDGTRAVGTMLGKDSAAYDPVRAGRIYKGEAVVVGVPHYTIYMPIHGARGEVVGLLFAGLPKEKVAAAANALIRQASLVSLALMVVLVIAASVAAGRIVRPIPRLAGVMEEMATARTGVAIPYLDRTGEIGAMARAVRVFHEAEAERQRLSAEHDAETQARLHRQAEIERAIATFRDRAESALGAVRGTMGDMLATAGVLDATSRRTAAAAVAASEASSNAAGNVESVAGASEELSSSIQEIAGQVSRTTTVVGRAAAATRETNLRIGSLAQAANKIGEVVTLIQAIAEQTNLLALNATIEAARAGDAGRGFAVVATEVKSLAAQTGKATEEIAAQISAIQSSTGDAVTAIGGIAATMEEVNDYTAAIAAAVEQQGAATAEITRNIGRASDETRLASTGIASVSAAAAETIRTAESVAAASGAVAEQTERLRSGVDDFMRAVAAA